MNRLRERIDEEGERHEDRRERMTIDYNPTYNISMGSITPRSPTFANSPVREASYGEVSNLNGTLGERRAPKNFRGQDSFESNYERCWSDSTMVWLSCKTVLKTDLTRRRSTSVCVILHMKSSWTFSRTHQRLIRMPSPQFVGPSHIAAQTTPISPLHTILSEAYLAKTIFSLNSSHHPRLGRAQRLEVIRAQLRTALPLHLPQHRLPPPVLSFKSSNNGPAPSPSQTSSAQA